RRRWRVGVWYVDRPIEKVRTHRLQVACGLELFGVDGRRYFADRIPQVVIVWRGGWRGYCPGGGAFAGAFAVNGGHDDIRSDREAVAVSQPVCCFKPAVGAVEERTVP